MHWARTRIEQKFTSFNFTIGKREEERERESRHRVYESHSTSIKRPKGGDPSIHSYYLSDVFTCVSKKEDGGGEDGGVHKRVLHSKIEIGLGRTAHEGHFIDSCLL